jgi:hypothetical protein
MTIPQEILIELEAELTGLRFGTVTLQIVLHDSQPRYKVIREKSIVPGKQSSGAGQGGPQ